MVSDDPRCRLSLDDRVLGGLVRDTIARLHGTFGAAACSIGFAGRKLLGTGGTWRDWGPEEGERAQAARGAAKPGALSTQCFLFVSV